MKKRFKLILDVTYDTPKKHIKTLKDNLVYLAHHAMSEGLLTLNAETSTVEFHTVEVCEPFRVEEHTRLVEAMARALFVSAYADYCDEEGADSALPRACCGADWMDVAPTTPQYALDAANQLLGRFEERNRASIWVLLARAIKADDLPEGYDLQNPEYVRLFGHYLAMEALGHGVSWFDDHEKFEISFPHIEFEYEPLENNGPSPRVL